MAYIPRTVDAELGERLGAAGAVLIEGPRACGKTETARQAAASAVYIDTDSEARALATMAPDLLLEGATPRLIDEWQVAPQIWNHVRRAVDDREGKGQFILTGSAVPTDDVTRHAGAGRFSRLRMRPLSTAESNHSTAEVSLKALLDGAEIRANEASLGPVDVARRIVVGGWPETFDSEERDAVRFARDYLDHTTRVDVRMIDGTAHDPLKLGALIRSLARNSASEVSIATLAQDAGGQDGKLARQTVTLYLETLSRIFVAVEQPAWGPHLRSRATLRNAPKRHLVDPSLAAASLNATSDRLIRDPETLGLLFESMVFRDLTTYCQPFDGQVYHYRDSTGLEVDAIVDAGGLGWGAFEVKLNPDSIESAAGSLLRFVERVDTDRLGVPKFLAVIVPGRFGYVREDGIAVVPVGALGP